MLRKPRHGVSMAIQELCSSLLNSSSAISLNVIGLMPASRPISEEASSAHRAIRSVRVMAAAHVPCGVHKTGPALSEWEGGPKRQGTVAINL